MLLFQLFYHPLCGSKVQNKINLNPKNKFVCMFLDVSTTPSGKSALHLAAWKGPLSHVIALLDRGVPIDMYSTSPGNFL